MTSLQTPKPDPLVKKSGSGEFISMLFLALVFAWPLFAHGCHGDDVDHEPAILPPVQASAPTAVDSR